VTDGGFGKRTAVSDYRQQGRGGLGIKAMKLNDSRGRLVGGLVVRENDEVIAIKASGQITRSAVAEVPVKGRDTMGVKFVGVNNGDSVAVIALNPEATPELDDTEAESEAESEAVGDVDSPAAGDSEMVEGESAPVGDSEQAESVREADAETADEVDDEPEE